MGILHTNKATIIHSNNPLTPSISKEISRIDTGISIKEYTEKYKDKINGVFVCILNNVPLLRKYWNETIIQKDDIVEFRSVLLGERFNQDDIKAIQHTTVIGDFKSNVSKISIGIIPIPKTISVDTNYLGSRPSSTYSGDDRSNEIRIDESIPSVYGQNIIYPDLIFQGAHRHDIELAGQPFEAGTWYYHTVFSLSIGTVVPGFAADESNVQVNISQDDIERRLRINGLRADTVSNNINPIYYAWRYPGQPHNTETFVNTAGDNVTLALLPYTNIPGFPNNTLLERSLDPVLNTPVQNIQRPQVLNFTDTEIKTLTLHLIFPNGFYLFDIPNQPIAPTTVTLELYFMKTIDSVQFGDMLDRGVIDSTISTKVDFEITTAVSSARADNYEAFEVPLPEGFSGGDSLEGLSLAIRRSQVIRYPQPYTPLNPNISEQRSDAINLNYVEVTLIGSQTFDHITTLSVITELSNTDGATLAEQLKDIPSRLYAIQITRALATTSPLPTTFQHYSTDFKASTNAVWAIYDILRSTEGGGADKNSIDESSFITAATQAKTRGDTFNGIFDRQITVKEALQLVARTIRSSVVTQGGVVRLIRDNSQTIPVGVFNTNNIISGSLKLVDNLTTSDTVDGVEVEYRNKVSLRPLTVSTTVEGTTPTNPAKVTIFGINERAHALREALYIARQNRFTRTTITFATEWEGNTLTFGDLISISHDMPQWGLSGEIVQIIEETSKIILELSDWHNISVANTNNSYDLILRHKDNSFLGKIQVKRNNSTNRVELVDTNATVTTLGDTSSLSVNTFGVIGTTSVTETLEIYTGGARIRTQYALADSNTPNNIESQLAIVQSVKSAPKGKFTITAVNYDSRSY